MMIRRSVFFFLCVTVVAPVLLYTDPLATTPSFISFTTAPNGRFGNEIPILSSRSEVEGLSALAQESFGAVQEPDGVVYSQNFSGPHQISLPSTDGAAASTTAAWDLHETGEQKGRVLSEGNPQTHLETQDVIQQVTTEEGEKAMDLQNTFSTQYGKKKDNLKPEKISRVASGDRPDAKIQELRDQLLRAKIYLGLSSSRSNPEFVRDLRARVRDVQRILDDATEDADLPKNTHEKMKAMVETLAKGRQIPEDCSAVVKKLRAFYRATEEQLHAQKKQELFLTQVAAKTVPRGLHCLSLRLTTDYYSLGSLQQQFPNQEKLEDPKLHHYALFSDNVLATAVVVNSTVIHAKEPENHVFHIVTNRLNYAAMRMWFLANPPGQATIQVQNVEEFTWLNASYSPVLKQLGSQSMIDYYFRFHHLKSDTNMKFRNPKYLSILNHLRFYLPEILPKLGKVVFLDDDVVVQKDLTSLWEIDLKGKVNGAVETCGETFHRFDRYLNFSNPLISENFDARACGWAYGMNVFDLDEWKRQNITDVYHRWQNLNQDRLLWKLGTLPAGLVTFWNNTHPLDRSRHVLGLGYNPNMEKKDIEGAAVIHYNGNMKPWLDIGMSKYRNYWSKYVNYDQAYLRDCNINP